MFICLFSYLCFYLFIYIFIYLFFSSIPSITSLPFWPLFFSFLAPSISPFFSSLSPPPFLFFLVFILSRPFSSFHPSLLFRYCPFRWFYLISVSIHPSPSIQHSPPQGQWGRMQYTIKHALVSTYVLVLLEYFCQILFDLWVDDNFFVISILFLFLFFFIFFLLFFYCFLHVYLYMCIYIYIFTFTYVFMNIRL